MAAALAMSALARDFWKDAMSLSAIAGAAVLICSNTAVTAGLQSVIGAVKHPVRCPARQI